MSFAIICPSNDSFKVNACVSAIRAMGETAKVVIVDDGLDAFREDCQYIQGKKPFVFPEAINAGIKAARKHDFYVCVNDDALLTTPFGFTELCRIAAENPEYGAIGAVTNLTGQPLQRPHGIGLRQVNHFAYVCVCIAHSTLENIQWMDPRYCLDYGCCDRDHCEAINRAGSKTGVYDFCYVDHGSLKSAYRGNPEAPRSFAQNYRLLIEKWGTVSA